MRVPIDAIYENGVFRPLHPVELAGSEAVTFRITPSDAPSDSNAARDNDRSARDWAIVDMARAETAGLKRRPSIKEVRDALSVVPGSLSEDLIADRGE